MKRTCIVATLVVALIFGQAVVGSRSSIVSAKSGTPSSITMILIGLNCATPLGGGTFLVSSYSFGASQVGDTSSGGGSGTGKTVITDLNIQRGMDACSPALFGSTVSGKHFTTATMVQTDPNGNTLLTVTLTDVLVSGYQISGNQQNPSPVEGLSFAYGKICIEEASSGAKVCYDAAQGKLS